MVDLTPVLELLRRGENPANSRPQAGTGWEQAKILQSRNVPAVPSVPSPIRPQTVPSVVDVLERAAILEFVEGLSRAEADRLALAEHGCTRWDQLKIAGGVDGATCGATP